MTTDHERETPPADRRRGYRGVAEALRIRVGTAANSELQLPSEEALAAEFGVARDTVRRALTVLVDEGLIRSVHGRGHFVVGGQGDEQSAGMPRYLVVAQAIQERITTGRLEGRLPSEGQIQSEFEVSRNTARRAFTELETWGLVERRGSRRYARVAEH